MRYAWLIVLLAGCRVSLNKWGGTPPRAGNRVKIALHDNGGGELGRRVLTADARVEVIAFDPSVNEKQRTDCGSNTCPLALEPACKWAAQNGADYYAIASQGSQYSQQTKCTKSHTDWSKILDKHDDSEICDESKVTSEGTRSSFSITLYDTQSCTEVPALSQQVSSYASGNKEESGVESSMQVAQLAPTKYPGFPDQTVIGPDGHIVNAPGDGQYALFRDRQFEGIARVHHTGTPREHIHMLMCCAEVEPGDVLVKRGPMHFIEFDVSFDSAILETGTSHEGGVGAGIHIRHSYLAHGLQIGANADAIGSDRAGAGLVSLEAGWGYHLAPAFELSANADVGFAQLSQKIGDANPYAWTPFVMPQIRGQVEIRWWYLGLDLGFAMSSTIGRGDWSGANAEMAMDARLRGPVARLYTGLTL